MADEVLKDCEKYIVKRVVNPGFYWMTPLKNEKSLAHEVKKFEKMLAKQVTKIPRREKIPIGKMVAIKNESGFHRAIVKDVFCRMFLVIYSMLLVDHGKMTEVSEKNVYYIENDIFRKKKICFIKVSLHGIKPAALRIECERTYSSIIFQKRACKDWSPPALEFVNNIFNKNPCVFLKPISCEKQHISGEIYFLKDPEKVPVSLGEVLCTKGYALESDLPEIMESYVEGDIKIEENIPNNALSEDAEICDKPYSYKKI